MSLNLEELSKANRSDYAKINARNRIRDLRSRRPQKHIRNMWKVYDESATGRDFSEEHHAFLMKDPVFAAMDFIREITVDGSGDPNRYAATKIMTLMRDRKLKEDIYTALLEVIERKQEKIELTRYLIE